MEDDNGLDLTLSLPCGGPSASLKGKNGSGSETRVEDADRGSKLIDDFKNFLDGGTHKEDSGMPSQRSNQLKPEENLFYDLSKAPSNVDASSNLNSVGFWSKNDVRSTEVQEERRMEAGSKRKNLFDEINNQKRHEREAHLADLHDKTRTSHISITTDEGSTAENEDVADSEAEGSTSKLVQHRDDASKRHTANVGLSEGTKEVCGLADSSGVDSQGQRKFTISSDREYKVGHASYGVPFSGQSVNILNMPYPLSVKESDSNPVSGTAPSGYTIPGMIQMMAPANNDRTGTQQPVIPANMPLMFGYNPVQVSTVEPGKSDGMFSHPLQFHPSSFARGPQNSNKQNDGMKITEAAAPVNALKPQYDGRALERTKGDGKHAKEEGSSSHTEGVLKTVNGIGMAKGTGDQARTEGIPPEYPAIRPGIAAELKFGGSGSSPNLPWVSTTGTGGKTISGVTYKYSGTQIRIVCACHGSHMSPEEFVQHANEEQPTPNGGGSGLTSFPNSNPAASAQS